MFLDDFRLAARRLRQRPGFTAVAVLTLALGLGANIAIFTLVRATMFQRLPVANPDELIRLGDNDNCCVNSGLQNEVSLFSYTSYSNLRDHLHPTAQSPRGGGPGLRRHAGTDGDWKRSGDQAAGGHRVDNRPARHARTSGAGL